MATHSGRAIPLPGSDAGPAVPRVLLHLAWRSLRLDALLVRSELPKAMLLAAGRHDIPLPGRELPVPRTIMLAEVQERMYPTEPFVQSTDVSESMCPE